MKNCIIEFLIQYFCFARGHVDQEEAMRLWILGHAQHRAAHEDVQASRSCLAGHGGDGGRATPAVGGQGCHHRGKGQGNRRAHRKGPSSHDIIERQHHQQQYQQHYHQHHGVQGHARIIRGRDPEVAIIRPCQGHPQVHPSQALWSCRDCKYRLSGESKAVLRQLMRAGGRLCVMPRIVAAVSTSVMPWAISTSDV